MKLTRANFQQLLTPIHRKIIFQSYKLKEEQFKQIFEVIDMKKKEETWVHEGAFGMWDENTEGNTINEDEMNEGDTATMTAKRFDKGYSVTWELTRDDLYGVLDGKGKGGSAKTLGAGLRRRIDTQTADVLNTGFTNVGYDGFALFVANRTLIDSNLLQDNLMTGALTPATLKTGRTKMRNLLDPAGNKTQAVARQLITGPDLEFTSIEITQSQNQAYEQSNTTNVNNEGIKPIVMDYITGDSWFLRDPSFKNLVFGWRDKPMYDSQQLPKTVDFFMYGFTRYGYGYYDSMGLIGSQGA